MTPEEVEDKLRAVVADLLQVDPKELKAWQSFIEDLGADSLAIVELIPAIEDAFDVKIPDSEVDSVKTFGQAYDYILRRVRSR